MGKNIFQPELKDKKYVDRVFRNNKFVVKAYLLILNLIINSNV